MTLLTSPWRHRQENISSQPSANRWSQVLLNEVRLQQKCVLRCTRGVCNLAAGSERITIKQTCYGLLYKRSGFIAFFVLTGVPGRPLRPWKPLIPGGPGFPAGP